MAFLGDVVREAREDDLVAKVATLSRCLGVEPRPVGPSVAPPCPLQAPAQVRAPPVRWPGKPGFSVPVPVYGAGIRVLVIPREIFCNVPATHEMLSKR